MSSTCNNGMMRSIPSLWMCKFPYLKSRQAIPAMPMAKHAAVPGPAAIDYFRDIGEKGTPRASSTLRDSSDVILRGNTPSFVRYTTAYFFVAVIMWGI